MRDLEIHTVCRREEIGRASRAWISLDNVRGGFEFRNFAGKESEISGTRIEIFKIFTGVELQLEARSCSDRLIAFGCQH
jgi:hypothetical protein